jgi:hypothetical protein
LLSKNVKIEYIYETIILPLILYGSLTLREVQTGAIGEQGAEENIWTREG